VTESVGESAPVSSEEVSASLAARRELGPEYEAALADALAERVEQVVQARVEARMAQTGSPVPQVPAVGGIHPNGRIAIAVVSLAAAIPCSAIAAAGGGVAGIVVAWAGIAAVNLAVAINPGRGRR
jgi:hypothetical protein